MQGFGFIKSFPENIYLKDCFSSFSQSALFFYLHPELLSGVLKVSNGSGHDLIFVEVDGKCQFSVDRAPFMVISLTMILGAHLMTIVSHGTENADNSQVWQIFL